jgi:hypothetical protein
MGSYGYNTRWAMEAAGDTFDSSSLRFAIIRDTIGLDNEKFDGDGTTGTRSLWDINQRDGNDNVTGDIEFHPTFNLFDALLPYMLGGAESSDTFPLADTLPAFDRVKDLGGKIVKHSGLVVSKSEITFGPGLLKTMLNCVGKSEVATGLSWASAALGVDPVKDKPFAFQDCTVTINSGSRVIRQGSLVVDNGVEAQFGSGSVTAYEVVPQSSRIVTLSSRHPSRSAEWDDLYATTGVTGTDGNTATIALVYTNGTNTATTTFTLRKLRAPKKTPVFESKGEIFYVPEWQARHDGTNMELTTTNVYA